MDFDGKENDPSPAQDGNGSPGQREDREGQYLATAGVGIRVKAFKKPASPTADEDLFETGDTPQAPVSVKAEPTPVTEVQPAPVAEVEPNPAPEVEPKPAPEVRPSPAAEADPPPVAEVEAAIRPATANAAPSTPRKPAPAAKSTGPSKRGRKSLKQATAEADLIEIPADEVLFAKQYYTMGEVSQMFKVNQSLLRYWETEFDILQPRKNKKGDRYFRPVDIKNLHLIYHLLRQRKYTIEGAKDFLRNNKKVKERFEVIERLQQIRNFLLEWKAQL
jgi:DNA-binding transcriptional MerR regulator